MLLSPFITPGTTNATPYNHYGLLRSIDAGQSWSAVTPQKLAPEARPSTIVPSDAITVAVDVRTGDVKVLNYAVAHDCGRVINPLIVEGQVQGGIAHGIGNCFYEELIYDDDGQLLNASFMDYLLPSSHEIAACSLYVSVASWLES